MGFSLHQADGMELSSILGCKPALSKPDTLPHGADIPSPSSASCSYFATAPYYCADGELPSTSSTPSPNSPRCCCNPSLEISALSLSLDNGNPMLPAAPADSTFLGLPSLSPTSATSAGPTSGDVTSAPGLLHPCALPSPDPATCPSALLQQSMLSLTHELLLLQLHSLIQQLTSAQAQAEQYKAERDTALSRVQSLEQLTRIGDCVAENLIKERDDALEEVSQLQERNEQLRRVAEKARQSRERLVDVFWSENEKRDEDIRALKASHARQIKHLHHQLAEASRATANLAQERDALAAEVVALKCTGAAVVADGHQAQIMQQDEVPKAQVSAPAAVQRVAGGRPKRWCAQQHHSLANAVKRPALPSSATSTCSTGHEAATSMSGLEALAEAAHADAEADAGIDAPVPKRLKVDAAVCSVVSSQQRVPNVPCETDEPVDAMAAQLLVVVAGSREAWQLVDQEPTCMGLEQPVQLQQEAAVGPQAAAGLRKKDRRPAALNLSGIIDADVGLGVIVPVS